MQVYEHAEHHARVELGNDLTIIKWGEDFLRVKLPKDKSNHRFYPLNTTPLKQPTAIRLLNLGPTRPERIGSIHELNRYIPEPDAKLTINYHYSDRYAMMYYGHYDREEYVEAEKIDLPEMRVSPESGSNDPMLMDPSLKLIDVHYVVGRDDPQEIHQLLVKAVTEYLTKRGVEVKTKGGKLYWKDGDSWVKFYSGAPLGGHYYFYINLGIDYNHAIDYFKGQSRSEDRLAYGLPGMPDSMVEEVLEDFARLYGLPMERDTYSYAELAKLEDLDQLHSDRAWIEHGERSYPRTVSNIDGFEHEFDLFEKPTTNVFTFELEHSGLVFHYQPALTPEETAQGIYRADHVVGSYAVYHGAKRNNQYQTGKIAHIYRPVASDSTGREVYCDLRIENDVMSITLPQAFLDSAAYPVTVDPTFGYTSAGGTQGTIVSSNSTGVMAGLVGVSGTTGLISSFSFYAATANSGSVQHLTPALYSSGVIVDHGTETTLTTSAYTPGWTTVNSVGQASALSTGTYDVVLQADMSGSSGYDEIVLYFDTYTNAGGLSSTYSDSQPPPAAEPTLAKNNNRYSIYVTTSSYIPSSWNLVQSATNSGTSASPSVTISSAYAGHLLIAVMSSNNGTGSNSLSGWTTVADGRFSTINTRDGTLFYKTAAGGETTIAGATSSAAWQMAVFEYSGNAKPVVLDTSSTNFNLGRATVWTSTAITTPSAGDLIFSVAGQPAGNGGIVSTGVGGGAWSYYMTTRQANAQNLLIFGEYAPGAIVSGWTDTAGWTTSRANGGITAAFKPDPSFHIFDSTTTAENVVVQPPLIQIAVSDTTHTSDNIAATVPFSVTQLGNTTFAHGAGVTSLTTPSITPRPGSLLVVTFGARATSGSTIPPSISTTLTTSGSGTLVEADNVATYIVDASIWYILLDPSNPGTGTVTAAFPSSADVFITTYEVTGINTTTPVLQSQIGSSSSSAPSVSLASSPSAGNIVFGLVVSANLNSDLVPGSGFTEIDEAQTYSSTPNIREATEFQTGTISTSVGWSGAGTINNVMAAVELDWQPSLAVLDATSTSENVMAAVSGPAPLAIDATDSTATSESFLGFLPSLALYASDSTVTSENVVSAASGPQVWVTDATSTAENVSVVLSDGTVIVSESTATSENVVIVSSGPQIRVSDTVGTSDVSAFVLPESVLTSDSTAVLESVGLSITSFLMTSDAITLGESALAGIQDGDSISELVTLTESIEIALSANTISVSEAVGTTETAKSGLSDNQISLSEAVSLAEAVRVTSSDPALAVSDSITADENVIASLSDIEILVSEAIASTDQGTSWIQELYLSTGETIFVADVPLFGANTSGFEAVNAAESVNVSVGLGVSVGDTTIVTDDVVLIIRSSSVSASFFAFME